VSSIIDPIVAVIILVVMTISLVCGYAVYSQISQTSLVSPDIKAQGDGFYAALSMAMVLFVIIMVLSTIIAAYMVPANPVFAVVGVLLLFINVIVVPPLINMLNSFVTSPGMIGYAEAGFGPMIQVIQYVPVLTIVCSLLALIAGLWVSRQ
jgi:flagellin-like protein